MKENYSTLLEVIKENFPTEWKDLQDKARARLDELVAQRITNKNKPDLPADKKKEMGQKAQHLLMGRLVEFKPTRKLPFVTRCLFTWEDGTSCTLDGGHAVIFLRAGATIVEKAMLKLVDLDKVLEEIRTRKVESCKGVQAYNKEIKDFVDELRALKEVYFFDEDEEDVEDIAMDWT